MVMVLWDGWYRRKWYIGGHRGNVQLLSRNTCILILSLRVSCIYPLLKHFLPIKIQQKHIRFTGQTMEYQRVNEMFLEHLFLVRIYPVAKMTVLYEFLPNETKLSRVWKGHIFEGWQRWQGCHRVKRWNTTIVSGCNTTYYFLFFKKDRIIYCIVFVNRWQWISRHLFKVTTFVNVCQRNNLEGSIWYIATYPLSTLSTLKRVPAIFWNALNKKRPSVGWPFSVCLVILFFPKWLALPIPHKSHGRSVYHGIFWQ